MFIDTQPRLPQPSGWDTGSHLTGGQTEAQGSSVICLPEVHMQQCSGREGGAPQGLWRRGHQRARSRLTNPRNTRCSLHTGPSLTPSRQRTVSHREEQRPAAPTGCESRGWAGRSWGPGRWGHMGGDTPRGAGPRGRPAGAAAAAGLGAGFQSRTGAVPLGLREPQGPPPRTRASLHLQAGNALTHGPGLLRLPGHGAPAVGRAPGTLSPACSTTTQSGRR